MKNVLSTWIHFSTVTDPWLGKINGDLNLTNMFLCFFVKCH
jgi:hypothetical protein